MPPALISGILVLTFNNKLISDKTTMLDDFDYISVCLDQYQKVDILDVELKYKEVEGY